MRCRQLACLLTLCLLGALPARFAIAAPSDELQWIHVLRLMAQRPGSGDFDARFRLEDASAALARERVRARKAALPLTLDEWEGVPPTREANAAYDYQMLDRLLRQHPLEPAGESKVYSLGMPPLRTQELIRDVRRIFAERRDVVGLVARICSKPGCSYVDDSGWAAERVLDPFAGARPRVRDFIFREAARLVAAESLLYELDGRDEDAVALIKSGFQISSHALGAPGLVPCFTAGTCDEILRGGLKRMLAVRDVDPAMTARVQAALPDRRYDHWMQHAREGQLVASLANAETCRRLERVPVQVVDSPLDFVTQAMGNSPRIEYEPQPPLRDAEEVRLWDRLWEAVEAELIAMYEGLRMNPQEPWELRYHRIWLAEHRLADHPECPARSAAAWIMGMDVSASWVPSRETYDRLFRSGLAVIAYNAAHGAYPARLEQAIDPPPVDPYGGRPLKYRLSGAGFILSSIGPQKGHDEMSRAWPPGPYDFAFGASEQAR